MSQNSDSLAVVGMAGRFAGAANLEEFWENLANGVESISRFPAEAADGDRYVPARAIMPDSDCFDASFFGYSPKEAMMTDPQQRLFLECAWEALENAGYDPPACPWPVGVYAGSTQTPYDQFVRDHADVDPWALRLATSMDLLTGRAAYKLGLTGPAVTVQSGCSTSLVAVHVAGQALLAGDCDMALAGGVSAFVPVAFTPFCKGSAVSEDGYLRAFDAAGSGFVGGDGVGVVVLRRLEDALRDGDQIRAIVCGSALNNDGGAKIGFLAPSITGQAEVIRAAQVIAGVDAGSIGYVETHGTGTPLGDPVEIAGLTTAFRATTEERGFCWIGSVKTNIGHTDAAAGVASFIKTVLALEHQQIPPSLHFREANPRIDFADSPFAVNTALRDWKPRNGIRRAGVSSLGLGGTNAHVILQEAPQVTAEPSAKPRHLLTISAKTPAALDVISGRLARVLAHRGDDALGDIAWTLQQSRSSHPCRRFVVSASAEQASTALLVRDGHDADTRRLGTVATNIVFLFPGQGSQHPRMAGELYANEPVFREAVDECSELARASIGLDLRDLLYPGQRTPAEVAGADLNDMRLAQPAVFTVEYALSQLWQAWGLRPVAVLGHSLGAVTAACTAGVLSLDEAMWLVAERGRLLGEAPAGAMLAVAAPEAEIRPMLGGMLSVSAVNSPTQCVLAGPPAAIELFQGTLAASGVEAHVLQIRAAAHSAAVEPFLAAFEDRIRRLHPSPPAIPWMSDLTGTWVTAADAADPRYWSAHLREPVRFSEAVGMLLTEQDATLLEVGPGQTLTALLRARDDLGRRHRVLPSLPHPASGESEQATLLTSLGQLWSAGASPDWRRLYDGERRRRTPLPPYPFERHRFAPNAQNEHLAFTTGSLSRAADGAGPDDSVRGTVAMLFAEALGLTQIRTDDNFFGLGGDSLVAIRIAHRANEKFDIELPPRVLFTAPTVAELADVIEAEISADTAARQP